MTQQTVEHAKTQAKDMFGQAAENFKSVFETGLRFQQDAFKSMTDCFGQADPCEDTCHRMESFATDSINLIHKNAEQSQKLFDESCRNGVEMFKKTFQPFETTNGKNKDLFAQARDVWQAAFDAMRSNVEAAARTNVQAIENWSSFFSRCCTPEHKAAK